MTLENTNETNTFGFTEEEMRVMKEKLAREKQEAQRKQKLNTILNGENGEVYKELYNKGGLKDMIEKDPEILDSESALRLALNHAKSKYEQAMAPKEEPKTQNTATAVDPTPLQPTASQPQPAQSDDSINLRQASIQEIQNAAGGKLTKGDALFAKVFG